MYAISVGQRLRWAKERAGTQHQLAEAVGMPQLASREMGSPGSIRWESGMQYRFFNTYLEPAATEAYEQGSALNLDHAIALAVADQPLRVSD